MFNTTSYIDRRELLKQQIGQGGILLFLGNEDSAMNYADNTYPFRQDSTFLYYFGIQEPKLAAIIDIDEDQTILFGDELTIDEIVWMGRQETLASKSKKAGIENVRPAVDLATYLKRASSTGRTIHFLPPYRPENKLKLFSLLHIAPEEIASKASVPFIQAVVKQRSIKTDEELAEIENAVNTAVDMHLLAMRMAKPGITELEMANAIEEVAKNAGGRLAYPTILSVHGEILHNHHHIHTLKEGQLVLNDSGAETAMRYAGDLTRTFPVSRSFTTKQREIYQVVLEAFEKASAQLAPGTRYLDVHFTACKALVDGLKALGLMHGDTEEAVAAGAHTLFFQCGTGHMLGLDVHDMEDLGEQYVGYTADLKKNTTTFGLKSLRLGKALETGYVLTVEPGIYFIPELFQQWEAEHKLANFIHYTKVAAYMDFGGVRIEDNFVVTETGSRTLGKPLPKKAEEIEAIRQEDF